MNDIKRKNVLYDTIICISKIHPCCRGIFQVRGLSIFVVQPPGSKDQAKVVCNTENTETQEEKSPLLAREASLQSLVMSMKCRNCEPLPSKNSWSRKKFTNPWGGARLCWLISNRNSYEVHALIIFGVVKIHHSIEYYSLINVSLKK